MMSHLSTIALLALFLAPASVSAAVYELRTYTASEGKQDNVSARLRNTVHLLKKKGMLPVGYWIPTDEPKSKNTVIYVLKHESRDAAKASWRAFGADPAWKKIAKESRKDGQILAKAPDSQFMNAADYSPQFSSDKVSSDKKSDDPKATTLCSSFASTEPTKANSKTWMRASGTTRSASLTDLECSPLPTGTRSTNSIRRTR